MGSVSDQTGPVGVSSQNVADNSGAAASGSAQSESAQAILGDVVSSLSNKGTVADKKKKKLMASVVGAFREDLGQLAKSSEKQAPQLEKPSLVSIVALTMSLYLVQSKLAGKRVGMVKDSIEYTKQSIVQEQDKKAAAQAKKVKDLSKVDVGKVLGEVFGWVAVALSVVVGVALVVATGGSTGAVVMLALAAITGVVMTLQQTGAVSAAVKSLNLPPKVAMGLSLGITAIMLVASIGAAVVSGGSGIMSAFSAVSKFVSKALEVAPEVAEDIPEIAEPVADALSDTSKVAGDITDSGSEVTGAGARQATDMEETVQDVAKYLEDDSEEFVDSIESSTKDMPEDAPSNKEPDDALKDEEVAKSTQKAEAVKSEQNDISKEANSKTSRVFKAVKKELARKLSRKNAKKSFMSPKIQIFATRATALAQFASGAASVGGGAAEIDSGVETYDSSMLSARTKEFEASIAKDMGEVEQSRQRLQQLLLEVENVTSNVISILESTAHAGSKISSV